MTKKDEAVKAVAPAVPEKKAPSIGEELVSMFLQNLTVNQADPAKMDAIDEERNARDAKAAAAGINYIDCDPKKALPAAKKQAPK